jgi:diketogulonate reductase-like aldo/keto reductase
MIALSKTSRNDRIVENNGVLDFALGAQDMPG